MMDGDIPFPTEFKPVAGVPPIAVEMAVGEACDFGKGAEDVLEDDKEDEEEGNHEGEEKERDGFGEDEQGFGCGGDVVEAEGSVVQDGDDKFLAGDCEEEDAAEDGEGFPEELERLERCGAWVFELVAEGWNEDVVAVVGPGEVLRVGDLTEGGGEFEGKIFAEFSQGVFFVFMDSLFFGALGQVVKMGARARVADGCCGRGAFGVVEGGEAVFSCAEVAVVESVGMHFHEKGYGVEGEEDLGGPCPAKHEWPAAAISIYS